MPVTSLVLHYLCFTAFLPQIIVLVLIVVVFKKATQKDFQL